ncbi:MAG: undecaprenyl-diphosphate phosphatase [Acidimicrobiales bacterium]|nr:undecaprenyl-diphosphate phosphatase [Acidimicrobiales bacterium]
MSSDLSVLHAIVLGLVEGLTEFLPISSTGHLLVAQRVLGLGGTEDADMALDTYAICIQAGAIAAVLVLYRQRIAQLVQGLGGRSEDGRRLLIALVAAFIPAAAIGVALSDPIRSALFGVGPVAGAWIVGGLAILWVTRKPWSNGGTATLEELTVRHALIIGLAQALALWPGVSRSLVTILAGLALGYTMRAAVEFSFLLGLVTLTAATAYEGVRSGGQLVDTFGVATPLLGLAVAFVSAVLAVRWMVSWLQSRGLAVFGWYRIAIGVVAVTAIALG